MKNITITVDVEEDCPPMLTSTKGMEEGLPKLLDLFKKKEIRATFFVTGMIAKQYPDLIYRIHKECEQTTMVYTSVIYEKYHNNR